MILTNAALVLSDRVQNGSLVLQDGLIAEIGPPSAHPSAIDLDGDFLVAGIVDVHTDNLERQVLPRANARWPSRSAMLAHDAQCAVAGVTTVLDALCLGDLGFDTERIQTFYDGVADLDALSDTGLLRSEHFLHLRCELPAADMLAMLETVAEHKLVRMVSLMDHSPGVGQYADLDRYRALRRREGLNEAMVDARIAAIVEQRARVRGPNRRGLLARIAGRDVALASHDDRTAEEIAENAADGIMISEFPVSMVAALAAKAAGMQVIAGAPNIVRGGSHSGNVAAAELVRVGAADAYASDYVPAALMEAAFATARLGTRTLPEALAMVTSVPAAMAGLADRGRLAVGMRADLARVRVHDGRPVVRATWRAGERIA